MVSIIGGLGSLYIPKFDICTTYNRFDIDVNFIVKINEFIKK